MISTKIHHKDTPHIGNGRWTVPLHLLSDKECIKTIVDSGQQLLSDIDKLPKPGSEDFTRDPTKIQELYQQWKDSILAKIRAIARTKIPRIETCIKNLKTELKQLAQNQTINSDEKITQRGILEGELKHLVQICHSRTRDNMDVNGFIYREVIRKPWINENKERKPRDTFYKLKIPNSQPAEYSSSTRKMCEIARSYHDSLQLDGIPQTENNRVETIQQVTKYLIKSVPTASQELLEGTFTDDEIKSEIHKLPNGKAPGLDGLPHEFWKSFMDRHISKENSGKAHESFDIINLLNRLFNNVLDHGMRVGTRLAEGWMCPLYKKKDRTDIGNYRPITVLNADYKILTRILTVRLANIAPSLIHPDQAGFMPGRHIEDQTDLIHMMINKCELNDDNGALVFLDQEKAYDRIRHDYLWEVLTKAQIPKKFRNIIKSLYQEAYTKIQINGEFSKTFKVTRGVRQGDPLSCLLFNLAIEPLACMLRASELNGLNIKGCSERLICTLFADDTTIYLSHKDDFATLVNVLTQWCDASGAKFNINKTIILPVGNPQYRLALITTRKLKTDSTPADTEIQILADHQYTRVLGAYVGNHADSSEIWARIIQTIEKNLDRWSKSHPTQEGRRLIANMEIGGRTQYLSRVQGMPLETLTQLNKILFNFIWDGQPATIKKETLMSPIRMGGRKVIDLNARNEAIELRRLQRYFDISNRPKWAFVADEIFIPNIIKYNKIIDEDIITHPALQHFKICTYSRTAMVPYQLKRMWLVKDKYNVKFDPPSLPENLKLDLPLWHHIGNSCESNTEKNRKHINHHNKREYKCLRTKHKIQTVRDAINLIQRKEQPTHSARRNCKCPQCRLDISKGCINPEKCIRKCILLINNLPPKYRPLDQVYEPNIADTEPPVGGTPFSKKPTIMALEEGFRAMGNNNRPSPNPLASNKRTNNENITKTIVYTDGSCQNNGSLNAKAGAGVWFSNENPKNAAIKLPEHMDQSNNSAELTAILAAALSIPDSEDIHIYTDSKYAIDNLTTMLRKRENEGWINSANKELLKKTIATLRARKGDTYFFKVKGHSQNEGNDGADALALQGSTKTNPDEIDLNIPADLTISGMQLQGASQALFYRGIRETKEEKIKIRTKAYISLDMIRWAAKEKWGKFPNDASIWKAIRNTNIDRRIRALLYKIIHQTLRIGEFWDNIPNHENKANCTQCNTIENIEHILTECATSGQSTIWSLAAYTLNQRGIDISNQNIMNIISSPLAAFTLPNGKPDKALNRLYIIIMTESLYLIWLIRCEWRIQRKEEITKAHSNQEITSMWLKRIDRRIKMDQIMASKLKFKWRKISKKLVQVTWGGTLHNEKNLPEDWIALRRVLVGAEMGRRPPGRNR